MNTKVVFKDFEGLPHLRDYVDTLSQETVGRFKTSRPLDTTIILSIASARRAFLQPLFRCEVLVRGPQFRRSINIAKQSREFGEAVRSCLHAADKMIHRRVKAKVTTRRQSVAFQPVSEI